MVLVRTGSRISRRSQADEGDDQDGERMSRDYQDCIDEVKSEAEGRILGNLQLHNEALRRLKERRGSGAHSPGDVEGARWRRGGRRGSDKKFGGSIVKSLVFGSDLARSLIAPLEGQWSGENRRTSSGSGGASAVMPGRRESAAVQDVNADVIAMLKDIELSDSDSDWSDVGDGSGPPSSPPPAARRRRSSMLSRRGSSISKDDSGGRGKGGGGRRRSSLLRRTSSGSIRMAVHRAVGKRPPGRRSSASSISVSELELKLEPNPNAPPQSCDFASDAALVSQNKSDKFASDMALSGEQRPNSNEEGKGGGSLSGSLSSEDQTKGSAENAFEEGVGQSLEQPKHGVRRKGRRANRLGRRRSSLFSVDERRSSVNYGSADGAQRSSIKSGGSGSLSNSYTSFGAENSMTSSFNSATHDPDELVCGWGRRPSLLSGSITADHAKGGGEGGKLICGWDPSQSVVSNMSMNPDDLDEIDEKRPGDKHPPPDANEKSTNTLFFGWNDLGSESGEEELLDEDLQKAKEGCSLFNAVSKSLRDEQVLS